MVDILPQRWAGSQGSADAAIARIGRDRPLCVRRIFFFPCEAAKSCLG